MTQRDKMRAIFRQCGGDRQRAVAQYAEAEMAGQVQRRRNTHRQAPHQYAARLLEDGLKKRWIHQT